MNTAVSTCAQGTCGCGTGAVARIDGIALHRPGESLAPEELRERAWAELLRQEAVRQGLLPAQEGEYMPELSPEEHEQVARMADEQVSTPEPTAQEARGYYDGHTTRFVQGSRARLRHILFAVTPGVDVSRLAARAEQALLELSRPDCAAGRFAQLAGELSNCPSGAEGGELGWVNPQEIAPELATELFHQSAEQAMGLRPRLIHSRFGFHVIDVQERETGRQLSFEDVSERIKAMLAQQSRARALHQYIRVLAGKARVEGIELEAAQSPLVQ